MPCFQISISESAYQEIQYMIHGTKSGPMWRNQDTLKRNLCLWSLTVTINNLPMVGKDATWSKSVQFSSITQSCPTLCETMNRSTPGLPVYHQLPEFTQTHVHRVSDAIQPSHSLSSPSPLAPNPSQHQQVLWSKLNTEAWKD